MKTLSISEARRQLAALAEEVAATGEPITVTRRGVPVIKLVACVPESVLDAIERHPLRQMEIQLADDFDEPLDDIWEALEP